MASVAKLRGSEVHVPHPTPGLSTAETILQVLRGGMAFTRDEAMLLDVMLMLHAEHGGGNNSTFACRVLSSSATDPYSAYAAAIGSLKGPRHGGANAKVVSMHEDIRAHVSNWEDEDEVAAYLARSSTSRPSTARASSTAWATPSIRSATRAPRSAAVTRASLAAKKDLGEEFALIERIERLAPQVMCDHGMTKPICANIDLYTGFIYKMLGVPDDALYAAIRRRPHGRLVGAPHGRALLRAPYHPPRLSSGDRAAGVQAARRPLGRGPL